MKIPNSYEVGTVAEDITFIIGEGREVSLVITKLEEALLWLSKVPVSDPD
jgi:hypothetical protein